MAAVQVWVVVTENAVDFVLLFDPAGNAGVIRPPVVLAPQRALPASAGAVANELAQQLARWADDHADPYRHVHWLS